MSKDTLAILKGAPSDFYIDGRDAGYGEMADIIYKLLFDKVKLGCPMNQIVSLPEELQSGMKVILLQIDPTNVSDALSGLDITSDYTLGDAGLTHLSSMDDLVGTYLGLGATYTQKEPSFTITGKFPKSNLQYVIHYWKTNIEMDGNLTLGQERTKLPINVESLRVEDKSPNYHGFIFFQKAT
jgi:hypothetical protein